MMPAISHSGFIAARLTGSWAGGYGWVGLGTDQTMGTWFTNWQAIGRPLWTVLLVKVTIGSAEMCTKALELGRNSDWRERPRGRLCFGQPRHSNEL
jgi:hypothetical protein